MSTTPILSRKGTASILGTLIFVSIIFTAFIPMMLVMRQADTLYDLRKHELGILDQEREDEEVYVYVYPVTETATSLTLKIQNRGNLVIEVVQIWINDVPIDLSVQISSMSSAQLIINNADPYWFTPQADTVYLLKINTARGNVFSSDSGSLSYNGATWDGGAFALNFLITNPESGWYEIEIWYEEDTLITLTPLQVQKSANSPAFAFYQVDIHGTYHVHITKNSNFIHDADTEIFEFGSPVEWVFA